MRKLFLIGIISLSFLLVACSGKDKKLVCSYDGESIGADQTVEVTLDSNDKVSKIENGKLCL